MGIITGILTTRPSSKLRGLNQQKKKDVQADTQQTDSNTLEQIDSDRVIQKSTRCKQQVGMTESTGERGSHTPTPCKSSNYLHVRSQE